MSCNRTGYFCVIYSIGLSIANVSEAVAQEILPDRQTIWLRAVDHSAPDSAKVKAEKTDSRRESSSDDWVVALQPQLASKEPWTDAQANNIFQQLCRMSVTGKKHSPIPRFMESKILFPLKFDVQARAIQRHPIVGWAAGSYAITTSPHFAIATQGSTKQAIEVARICEQTYSIWQQLFFSMWCEAESLQKALITNELLPESKKELFQIVLFRNREGYLKQLQQLEPNVAVSTGYYSPKLKTVFCYWDNVTSAATLRHELTHQFFSQAIRGEVLLPEELRSDFWVVEGLALYMESIQIVHADGYDMATIGGWDAVRLQPARYRRLHDETWISWDEFRRANNERFRTGSEIKQWYSQAAGLAHFWLDGNRDARQAFLDYARRVYRGAPNEESFIEAQQDATLRQAYDQFLMQAASKLLDIPPSSDAKEVVLSRCPVVSESLLGWPELKRSLDWLDLSFSQVDDRLFIEPSKSASRKLWDVRRLNVESTAVTDISLPIIAMMPRLEELDLSRCGITDSGLEALRGHKSLKTLWLTGNPKISDQGLTILASLPRLELTDLSETSVTEEGWKNLLSKSPRLRRKNVSQ